ncbi:Ribosomal large subunit pseudouridine synthase D [Buchnera aphidicola (Cinara cf. splendens/pseudotsugae 3390)]|uniref:Pseudouridine synthase n=1 Tax=Buchnera aphidicola (Cinara cf. splendens/pseudotsugae 3390) TaxID=2518980 RepID=A0A451CX13_9GAMM|nr:Ribosomal large subunit pseudouridine synthase D [Buchnera aphidicola (Cinara cf. splendens/pseudotsugae 3390)]
MSSNTIKLKFISTVSKLKSCRLDKILVQKFFPISRSCIKKWILSGCISVNDVIVTVPKKKIFFNDLIIVCVNNEFNLTKIKKENIPLDIIFEDSEILIINKPSNFVVHLGYGNISGTLLNALIFHYKSNSSLPRAGIVHRLDKNTSGLLVVAKTILAYNYLIGLFKNRKIIKEYDAIVVGRIGRNGSINYPIKRNIYRRTIMTIGSGGKKAITHYKVITRFKNYTYVRVQIKTGRMHQIRVHFSSIAHPIFGDSTYSKGIRYNSLGYSKKTCIFLCRFSRPSLHSRMLSFVHPVTDELKTWITSPPLDMVHLLTLLYCEDMV